MVTPPPSLSGLSSLHQISKHPVNTRNTFQTRIIYQHYFRQNSFIFTQYFNTLLKQTIYPHWSWTATDNETTFGRKKRPIDLLQPKSDSWIFAFRLENYFYDKILQDFTFILFVIIAKISFSLIFIFSPIMFNQSNIVSALRTYTSLQYKATKHLKLPQRKGWGIIIPSKNGDCC